MTAATGSPENLSPTAPLYSELPYPADGVVRTTNARILRAGLEEHAPHLLRRERLRIVDVGCGTGENTAGLRRIFPRAEIIGADINPPSLEMARELASRVGADVRFVQCDITRNLAEELAKVSPGPFDVVFSMGVLHHLAQPEVGVAAVRQLVAPDGLLFCFLYSRFGRREDLAAKELLSEIAPQGSMKARGNAIGQLRLANRHSLWGGIQTLGRRFRFGPPLIPSELVQVVMKRNRLVHESDSYSNPCEHLYLFDEIQAMLERTGWGEMKLAKGAGLPVSPEQHTSRASELKFLHGLSKAALYDYFAFYYQAHGFSFYAAPRSAP